MRVAQIIDSMAPGGAERLALNYANALAHQIELSALIVTRHEGALNNLVDKNVSYLLLNKTSTFDLKAIFKLKRFIKSNKIDLVHAHGTSFFIAVLLKIVYPKIKIIWHEHYGARANQRQFQNPILLLSSLFFSLVFVVNHQLEEWVKKSLFTKNVFYIPNFAVLDDLPGQTILRGESGKRIVCLANLKSPKNHRFLLDAFKNLAIAKSGWSLHFIGKDYQDSYSEDLKKIVNANELTENVFFYDAKDDIKNILSQATIGVLASTHEGFPLTILEYGLAELPVVATNVGYCGTIIKDEFSGLLFSPLNLYDLESQLKKMIGSESLRAEFALHLNQSVSTTYAKEPIMKLILLQYHSVIYGF